MTFMAHRVRDPGTVRPRIAEQAAKADALVDVTEQVAKADDLVDEVSTPASMARIRSRFTRGCSGSNCST